ncbi:hypothetical protein TBLA_0C07230 [Henningerozyma blattae CBS 6284]|uniref:Beta-mannosyltransferase 1 n=1 Tax=Henningerozyma blattae (strain ATCC 34711 / CBS 6284 / DSM 70876 / NBRC 10599 / NRRL Y-10934 / UCD 77-7) TaxID=1071380 RepID=I2H2B2_HENB6|nr:hypothetical protein TBLA_0C07230 [Tetrapisispora blattae CBS 6284]CCH60514.1 hypothetical protein TBLA_0C07230 [Tetrapisispora blattae CBS 6284]
MSSTDSIKETWQLNTYQDDCGTDSTSSPVIFAFNDFVPSSSNSLSNLSCRFNTALNRYSRIRTIKNVSVKIIRSKIFILFIIINIILGLVCPFQINGKQIATNPKQFYKAWTSTKEVTAKKDLMSIDMAPVLKFQNNEKSAINSRVINDDYKEFKIKGYVSNLNIKSLIDRKRSKLKKEDYSKDSKNSEKLLSIAGFEVMLNNDYSALATCEDLEYSSKILYSKKSKLLEDDLIKIRKELIANDPFIGPLVHDETENDWTDKEIMEKRWFRFGASSIWLESEQCYITVSRIVFSRAEEKSNPDVSLIRAQAFDKDWNEIQGKRIPKVDLPTLKDVENELNLIDKEFGLNNECDKLSKDSVAYDNCMVSHAQTFLEDQKRRDAFINRYFVTYPTVYSFPFKTNGKLQGPEDARIILRKTDTLEEPMVFFNMDTDHGRKFFTYMPHRFINPLIEFDIKVHGTHDVEKNWAPFFHEDDTKTISLLSRGFIHFVYSFSPFEVIKCSLNDGMCEKVFEKKTLALSNKNNFGGMRGGTQIVQLPSIIPKVTGKQMWLGIAKSHIENCGCGRHFYRPMLSLFVESNGIYHQELIVPSMDLNSEILNWKEDGKACDYKNVMSPNSIAAWEVLGQDPKTKKFDDYLVFTYSESDILSKVITIRGILDYILRVYGEKDLLEDFIPSTDADSILGTTLDCMINYANDQCKNYGASRKTSYWDEEKAKWIHDGESPNT